MFSEKTQKQVCAEVYVESQVDVNLVFAKHITTHRSQNCPHAFIHVSYFATILGGAYRLFWGGSASEASHAERNLASGLGGYVNRLGLEEAVYFES